MCAIASFVRRGKGVRRVQFCGVGTQGGEYLAAPAANLVLGRASQPGRNVTQTGVPTLALSQAEFDRMASEYGPNLFRMAFRMVGDRHEAEDVVQETFRSAWKSRRLYRTGGSGRAWLATILRRRVADHWRKPTPPKPISGEQNIEIGTLPEDPLRDEYTDEMQRALGHLPPDLKETLLLVVVAGLTHQEAADQLKIPLGTVLSRVSRARRKLREYLVAADGITR
jgi:RNA polymerase sigma-70 factor (ECF subfamily)